MNTSVEAHRDDLYTTSTWHPAGNVDHRIFTPVIFEGMDILRYFHEQKALDSTLTQEAMKGVYDLDETVLYAEGNIPWEILQSES